MSCIFISSCATLNVKPIGTQQYFVLEDDEKRLWERSEELEEILARSGFIYNDKELTQYLNNLANTLLPQEVKSEGLSVKVFVLKDPSLNAFILPNGTIYIHTGLLASIENEAQLATVLAHELVHFINRHSLKHFRNLINQSAFFSTLYVASASTAPYTSYGDLSNLLIQFGFLSSVTGYSREMESEADTVGFKLLVENNYETQEAPKAFESLERDIREEKIKEPFFFSTHPKVKERIKNFRNLCKLYEDKAYEGKMREHNKIIGMLSYNEKIKKLLLDNAFLDIKKNRFKSSHRAIERYLKLEPQDPKAYYYLGELFRQRQEEGDLEKAVENYKKAISLDNNFVLAHRALGFIYYKNKQDDEAIKEFETYLFLNPNADDQSYINKYLSELKGKRKEQL